MDERRGYDRIKWLLEAHEFPAGTVPPSYPVPRWLMATQSEVMVECTAALIEVFGPYVEAMAQPQLVIHDPERR